MNKKTFLAILAVFVLLTLNICAAQEMENTTIEDVVGTPSDSESLEVSNDTQVLETSNDVEELEASSVNTKISVESTTSFDVIGDYFKVKLTDANNKALKNTKITFTVDGKTFNQNTDSSGIASLQLRLKDGSYKIVSKFAGNTNCKASSLTTKITMDNTREIESGMSNSEIQDIIDNAKANNVILFKGSSYSDINLVITKSLTLQTNVGTTLKSSSSNPVITIKGSKASLSKVKGFTIEGAGDGIYIDGADYVTIYGNDITSGNGIVGLNTKYLNITKNNIVKNSKSGISIADSDSTYIFNNKISNNKGNGIEVAKSENVYINGNTLSNNKKNGIFLSNSINDATYSYGPGNVYIHENSIVNNDKSGIYVEKARNNISINSNDITKNWGDGISIAKIGSNKIQSNVITENHQAGINFLGGFIQPKDQDISYNAIFGNVAREIEAKDTIYDGGSSFVKIGANWYSDSNTLCPKIKTKYLYFVVKQTGQNQFQASFIDSKGNIASLLPDRILSYSTNDGKYVSITMRGGVATFTVDANDGDIINAVVDYSPREKEFNSNTPNSKPINGKTPTYNYPSIPNYQLYDDIGNSNWGNNMDNPIDNSIGNGGGTGDGNGNGEGVGGDASKGRGVSTEDSSNNNGNATYSQRTDPANSANNQVNDVLQSYETDVTTSQASASEESRGNTGNPGTQSESVVKQIIIDEDEFFRVTGMSLIVLLIILTVGFYYRDDIKEMNSKR